jgi:hypothetical protein
VLASFSDSSASIASFATCNSLVTVWGSVPLPLRAYQSLNFFGMMHRQRLLPSLGYHHHNKVHCLVYEVRRVTVGMP